MSLDLDAIASRAVNLCCCDDAECRIERVQLMDRDVPALIAEVERLRAERDRTVEYCRDIDAASRLGANAFTKGARSVARAVLKGLGVEAGEPS